MMIRTLFPLASLPSFLLFSCHCAKQLLAEYISTQVICTSTEPRKRRLASRKQPTSQPVTSEVQVCTPPPSAETRDDFMQMAVA
ncbi:hypothetical protein GGR53DRAFT_490652 [Hypoxylon sp. FL1150]|nr:hypothetical protein GGR53DRAFT_490652 [Hypoxylon sp. FL1150]